MTRTQSNSQTNWVGRTISNRYQLEGILGQGGMSIVYKATDPNLQRTVAIKLIHPHLSNDSEFVRRFEQEAAAVAQLRHPNIIQVYDFNHDGDVYYMVLEYVPGETLQDRLYALTAANKRLPLADATRIMATVCDAVAYAHEHGMIHRDLKPANVMLNPQGEPILMDFGVAKILDGTQHTATGTVVGTAKYMSPEQARGTRPDERADVYSLGVIFYEMITGQPPYDGESAISIMMKHVSEPLPDIYQLQSNAPDELVEVIQKALAKSPTDRYQTAAYMATGLRDVKRSLQEVTIPSPRKKTRVNHRQDTDPSGIKPTPIASTPEPASSVMQTTQPARKSNRLLWIAGIGVAVVIFLLGLGAVFAVSRFAQPSSSAEEQALASANLPSSKQMVKIYADSYTIGSDATGKEYAPTQQVELAEFWIDQFEATNAQYAEFLAGADHEPPGSWSQGTVPPGQENHPVEGITWDMAAAYCNWVVKRLPTEAEWEVAARGSQSLAYPWGDNERDVELPRAGTYAVGSIAANRSPFGVFDMAGNVWEWVGDPYVPVEDGNRILRGGAHGFLQDMAYRLQGDPNVPTMSATAGVRCAADEVTVVETETVLFEDNFTDPASGWPELEEGNDLFGYHPPDFYHVEVHAPGEKGVVTRGPNFDNITAETGVFVAKTDTDTGDFRYGLVVRRSGEQYYAFTISPRSKAWYVLKSSADGLEVLKRGTNVSIQGLSEDTKDILNVYASGSNFIFHINGQPVTQFSDSDYPTGEVGFYIEAFDETMAHNHYDTLTIRQAEARQQVEVVYGEGVLSHDDFTNPDSGWPMLGDENGLFGYHPPDFYHVEVSAPNTVETVSRGPDFDDITIESNIFVAKTDTDTGDFRYGLVVRRAGEQFYAFTISSRSKNWYALKSSASRLEVLAEGTNDSVQGLNESSADTLRVDASGSNFIFHINGQPVVQVSDADYTGGEVGFFTETFDESMAHVHYDTLTIREVEFEPLAVATPIAEPTAPTSVTASDVITPSIGQ